MKSKKKFLVLSSLILMIIGLCGCNNVSSVSSTIELDSSLLVTDPPAVKSTNKATTTEVTETVTAEITDPVTEPSSEEEILIESPVNGCWLMDEGYELYMFFDKKGYIHTINNLSSEFELLGIEPLIVESGDGFIITGTEDSIESGPNAEILFRIKPLCLFNSEEFKFDGIYEDNDSEIMVDNSGSPYYFLIKNNIIYILSTDIMRYSVDENTINIYSYNGEGKDSLALFSPEEDTILLDYETPDDSSLLIRDDTLTELTEFVIYSE